MQIRLLMCYVATHPEKLDATKEQQWQKLAGLSPEDMSTVTNLEFLGVPVRKRGKATGLNFGRKRKRAVRKASRTFEIQIFKHGENSSPDRFEVLSTHLLLPWMHFQS